MEFVMFRYILKPKNKPIGCILALPGRGGNAVNMANYYKNSGLNHSLIIGLMPRSGEWYPIPNGPSDQKAAVAGLEVASDELFNTLHKIKKRFNTSFVFAGFSAGAVVALYTALKYPSIVNGIVCHSGAYLEPEKIPPCRHQEHILLTHCKDDMCFKWEERYHPMKKGLQNNGYFVSSIEHDTGNHRIFKSDIITAGVFLAPLLGYS
jgi:predicted esterase